MLLTLRLGFVTFVAALILASCRTGGSGDAELQQRLGTRLGLTQGQLDCVWPDLSRNLSEDEIDQIADQGLTGISAARWGAVVHPVLRCGLDPSASGGSSN